SPVGRAPGPVDRGQRPADAAQDRHAVLAARSLLVCGRHLGRGLFDPRLCLDGDDHAGHDPYLFRAAARGVVVDPFHAPGLDHRGGISRPLRRRSLESTGHAARRGECILTTASVSIAGPKSLAEAIDVIEEAYEFMLAYAAQGRRGEDDDAGSGIRDRL